MVHATEDTIFPPEHGEAIASGLRNARLVVLEGGRTLNNQRVDGFKQAV
ncbi:MAG: hypothetical protein IIC73_07825, partial [Armatimonadetes bacterium]|nr:hypothetical protein [Armatimonadota bacterium]